MGDSFEGIAVPQGSPGELDGLSSRLAGMAGTMEGTAMRLRGLPASMPGWHGPASVTFTATALAQADAAHGAALAFVSARDAVHRYAHELRDAKREARAAIEDARDARHRITVAERDIVDARGRLTAARMQAAAAAAAATGALLTGGDASGHLADQQAAERAVADAEGDLRSAERRLDHAREDLERAQKRGRRAADTASDAERAVVTAYAAISAAVPTMPSLGPPARPSTGGRTARPAIPGLRRFGPGSAAAGRHPDAVPLGRFPYMPPLLPIDRVADGGSGSGHPNAGDGSVGLNVAGGMLSGAGARRAYENYLRYERRAGQYGPWRAIAGTADQEIQVSQLEANAGRAAQASRGSVLSFAGNFKGAAGVLTVAGAGFQYKANADEGMNTAENAVRTASSTGGSALGGTLLGGACAFSGVGTVATGGCAVVGGVVGGWAGDKAGQGVYWVGSHADDAWDATGGQIVHLLGG